MPEHLRSVPPPQETERFENINGVPHLNGLPVQRTKQEVLDYLNRKIESGDLTPDEARFFFNKYEPILLDEAV